MGQNYQPGESAASRRRAHRSALAHELLSGAAEGGALTISIDEHGEVTITIRPGIQPTPAAAEVRDQRSEIRDQKLAAEIPSGLSPGQGAVWESLTGQPQTAKKLADRTGYHLKSVQDALRALCRAQPPRAHRSADGYTRPGDGAGSNGRLDLEASYNERSQVKA
jgi:hypothetical protein